MAMIDIVFLVTISLFSLFGLWFGFIYTLGSAVGFFLGIFLASRFFDYYGGGIGFKIFLFVAIFIIVGRLVGLLFYFLGKLIKIIPFTTFINRILGGAFGFIEGILIVVGVVFIINFYNLETWFSFVKNSQIVPFALKLSKILLPFVTKGLTIVKSVI